MKLVFILGDAAVGKMTASQELLKAGYNLDILHTVPSSNREEPWFITAMTCW